MVLGLDFSLDFSLEASLVLVDSLFGDFSVFALGLLFVLGLVAFSAAGLLLAGLFVVDVLGDALVAGAAVGDALVGVPVAAGVVVAAGAVAEADGVIVAPALAAGVALAPVEAALLLVVPVVVVPVVVVAPVVVLALTPKVVGTVTP